MIKLLVLPNKQFLDFYLCAVITFAALVAITAVDPVVGGIGWIAGGVSAAWIEFKR